MAQNCLYYLAATIIFLSSFLLFQVQPLIGKHMLPWFGGSAAVWLTAMLFFMVALGVGYGYALLISRLVPLVQVIAHSGFLLVVGILLWRHATLWPSAITPSVTDVFLHTDPAVAIISTLFISIGLPFVALSATSTLVQFWYGRLAQVEPFALYSISNIGSLLGLLSYPFVFERIIPTVTHGIWWSFGFALYAALLLVLMVWYGWRVKQQYMKRVTTVSLVTWPTFLRWVGLTAVPVAALVSGTKFLTSAVAPVPFLWVAPLALYLLSFIISFRTHEARVTVVQYVVMVSVGILAITLSLALHTIILLMPILLLVLFCIYHLCHEALYAARPHTEQSPLYYTALALGGIVGSGVMTVVSLYLLVIPIEFIGVITLVVLISIWQIIKYNEEHPLSIRFINPKVVGYSLMLLAVALNALYVYEVTSRALAQERNFFGAKAVYEYTAGENLVTRSIAHGKTNHGSQLRSGDDWLFLPTSYYATSSGVGRALTHKQAQFPEGLRIAVMGLGSGGLAAYCRPQDEFTFIEIDHQMVELARTHFSWLEFCPQAQVVVTDGRLALATEALRTASTSKYDLIILDAYADDMMPIHLMTNEALLLYRSLLADDGVIALNISSRYLDLRPVLASYAQVSDVIGRVHYDFGDLPPGTNPSLWGVFSPDETLFTNESLRVLKSLDEYEPISWTDTYSALWPVVKVW